MNLTQFFLRAMLPLTAITILADSCSKGGEDAPTPPQQSTDYLQFIGDYGNGKATVAADGGKITLKIKSTQDWNVSIPQTVTSWVAVAPPTGSTGFTDVTISVSKNTSYDERNATLTFTGSSVRQTFVITQKACTAMILESPSKVELETQGGEFTVKISANVNVKYEIAPDCASWLQFKGQSTARALTSTNYTFKAAANEDSDTRHGVITFSSPDAVETVDVYQIGGTSIILTDNPVFVGAQGGSVKVEVKSNCDFSYAVETGADWLHTDKSRAISSHTIYFTADQNTSEDNDREAAVAFTADNGQTLNERLIVKQTAKAALRVMTEKIEAACSGGTFPIKYLTNCGDPDIQLPSWITRVEASRALTEGTIYVNISENYTDTPRSGEITVIAPDASSRFKIPVTQEAMSYSVSSDLDDNSFNDARSHYFTIDVQSPITPTFEMPTAISTNDNKTFHLASNLVSERSGIHTISVLIGKTQIARYQIKYAAPLVYNIPDSIINIDNKGGIIDVAVRGNVEISCNTANLPTWIKLKETRHATQGLANDHFIFEVQECNYSERTGVITLYASSWTGKVKVIQKETFSPGKEVEVEVTAPGNLADVVGENKEKIENLVTQGSINGADLSLIREMASEHALTRLDLSKTDLRADFTHPYITQPGTYYLKEDNTIGENMFMDTQLREVILSDKITKIDYFAFRNTKIENLKIPESVISVKPGAFKCNSSLVSVTVPSSLKTIPKYCFELCPSLSSLTLSEGIEEIQDYAFAPKGGMWGDNSSLRTLVLPSTLRSIGNQAFAGNKITSLVIPASVTHIGENAFADCKLIENITFECSLDTLPSNIFMNNFACQTIKFPAGLKVIGPHALDHLGMDYLTIPEGVVELQEYALNGTAKRGLVLPQSLEIIGEKAIGLRSQCDSFTIPPRVRKIGRIAFGDFCYITSLHIQCPTPPERDGSIFPGNFDYDRCTLYVPRGSADLYRADPYWLKFNTIIEE